MNLRTIRLSLFLAKRYVLRGSKWQTILVILVMMLTFVNVVVITGILLGLPNGAVKAYGEQYSGDVLISSLPEKVSIERSNFVQSVIEGFPEVEAVSARYVVGGELEAGYIQRVNNPNLLPDKIGISIVGLDPVAERGISNVHELMLEGEFIEVGDKDVVVIGAQRLQRYLPGDFGVDTLGDVQIGEKILLSVNGHEREVILKGVVKSKASVVDQRLYMVGSELRKMIGRVNYEVDEIAVKLIPGADPGAVKKEFMAAGLGEYGKIQTARDAIGTFLDDIQKTFNILGSVIGGIVLAVAFITIFIVIFISAVTRRKFIGILKAIGVTERTIELSYVFLSIFYSLIGITLGFFLIYFVLVPYFDRFPINFPFSDGILSITTAGTITRAVVVILATFVAGYLPAKLVVKKNALDAILGR